MAGGRRVVDHLHQAGDAAVNECAVTEDANHAPGLLWRQRVAKPESHADGRAHADQRIHRLEGRQNAQRVAADVARNDAVQIFQGLEKMYFFFSCGENFAVSKPFGITVIFSPSKAGYTFSISPFKNLDGEVIFCALSKIFFHVPTRSGYNFLNRAL